MDKKIINNEYKSFYKTVGGGEGDKCYYPIRLDPYGKGCFYNCSYCYAKSLLDFRKLWKPENVGIADINKIERKINKIEKGSVIRLGGMTDCFQPIENKIKNTYKTIQLLNKKGIHYLIVTKSDLITEYLDILDNELAHIQISIATNNNKILNLTDNAPDFEIRKNTIETLYDNNYDVSLRLAPFFYDTVNYNIINDINVDKCLVEFLRIKPSMVENLPFINLDDFTVKEGGYRHLPLNKKINIINKLKFKEISVCDDVKEHYDYFKENINYNKNDCCNLRI